IAILRKSYPNLPIVIFTYLNPIAFSSKFSFDEFCAKASESGADAMLCLDITPEEDSRSKNDIKYSATLKKYRIGSVSLITPTTPQDRIPRLAKFANSFIYYVSREGVTGESKDFSANFSDKIKLIKGCSSLPVVVGFGISTPEHVKAAASTGVDGVVVGSAIVRRIEALANKDETIEGIKNFVSKLKTGVKCG
ncbi:MAG TPA: tryptophan synthase subunit alpha, partial [Victivallales bacterium]|nr:tryptophan synthase subunit alpha [Victivallales bacterium]